VAWTPDLGYAAVDDKVLEVCGNAAAAFEEELGCHVEVVNPGWENPEDAFATIVAAQFYSAWSDALPAREADLDPTLVRFVRRGGAVTAREYLAAMSRVHVYWHEVRLFLERFDLLLTPTTAVPAFPLGAGVPRDIAGQAVSVLGWMPFAYPFNLTGQPAISVPAGFTEEAAGGPADRGTSPRRPDRAGRGGRVRSGVSLARPAPHAVTERRKRGPMTWSGPTRWALASLSLAAVLGLIVWLVATDAPSIRFVVRLYRDKHFLKATVASWGWAAPLVFIAIQAMQVIIAPIPGEITGPVGGALFGTAWGMFYSTVGLTVGTLVCFGLGRMWGEPLTRPWLSEHHWTKMNFIIEAEGAILCFILYLIPGFPKDIISYLFGMSPMGFWSSRWSRRSGGCPAPGSARTSAPTSASSSTSTRCSSSRSWRRFACRSTTIARRSSAASIARPAPRPQAAGKALDTPRAGTVEYATRYGQPDDADGLLLLLLFHRSLPTGSLT
jgi:uncharacterized membrane protein YdjX (TVP38/TMEM64 family)